MIYNFAQNNNMENRTIHIKRLSEEEFDKIYQRVPRACVDIIVNTSQGIIMTKRLISPCKDMWHIPGGTIYLGEKLEEAVYRVANDELGIGVKIKNMAGIIQYTKLCESSKHSIGIAFLCEPNPKKQKIRGSYQGEEIGTFKIIPENTVPEQKIFLEKLKLNIDSK